MIFPYQKTKHRVASARCNVRTNLMLLAGSALAAFSAWQLPGNFVHAQESHWTNAFGGNFGTAINWDNGVPAANTDAVFDLNATYSVNSLNDHVFQSIIQRDGDVTFNGNDRLLALGSGLIERGSMTVTGPLTTLEISNDLEIGSTILGPGSLNIQNDGVVSNANAYLGLNAGNVGNVNVSAAGSRWFSSNLFMGTTDGISDAGTGHLTLLNGGSVGIGNGDFSDLSQSTLVMMVEGTAGTGNLVLRNGSTITRQSFLK